MNIDSLDVYIILKILQSDQKKKEVTTWELAKDYDWGEKYEDKNRFLNQKTSLIKKRLKKMQEEKFVEIVKDFSGHSSFGLVEDKIIYGKHKFFSGYKDALHIKTPQNKWIIFEI
jgi:hypothetical protein